MEYKKHNWNRFQYGSNINIEIKLTEYDGRKKIDFFRCNNNTDFKKILQILKEKYDLG